MVRSTGPGCSIRIRETGKSIKINIMKIDFTKFPCYVGIRKTEKVSLDVSESLADAIYSNVPGIIAHRLAERIYSSGGEMELNEKEVKILTGSAELFTGAFADSMRDCFASPDSGTDTGIEKGL